MAAKVIHQCKWGVQHVSVSRLFYHVQILTPISSVVSEIINFKHFRPILSVIQYGRQNVNPIAYIMTSFSYKWILRGHYKYLGSIGAAFFFQNILGKFNVIQNSGQTAIGISFQLRNLISTKCGVICTKFQHCAFSDFGEK